jgi:DNA replication protein DnaC
MDNSNCIYQGLCDHECPSTCIKWVEMKYMLKHSNIPIKQQCVHKLKPDTCDVSAFERLSAIQMDIENFVYGGNTLYIYSNICGNGKTTWSIKMLLQYFNEVWDGNGLCTRGVFINVPSFIVKCKNVISNPDDEFERLRAHLDTVDLAVFDDVSAIGNLSSYDYSTLYGYIDSRVFQEKATIFTGNHTPEQLRKMLGDRLASRICQGVNIELKGGDMRSWYKSNY